MRMIRYGRRAAPLLGLCGAALTLKQIDFIRDQNKESSITDNNLYPDDNINLSKINPMGISDILRALQLLIIFTPCIMLYPLYAINILSTKMYYGVLNITFVYAGAPYIKLGQWMSSRPDIYSLDICTALASLQSDIPAESKKIVKRTIETSFGQNMDYMFKSFNWNAVGTGCIGQVYEAYLHSGEKVAVKVRRHNITQQIEQDMKIMQWFNYYFKMSQLLSPGSMKQLSKDFAMQTDLKIEAENLVRFNKNFSNNNNIVFPSPFMNYVNEAVLVETFLEGHTLGQCEKLNIDIDKNIIATNLMRSFMSMILRDNFIHGDLHPGNILILPNNVIGIIDTGLVIELSPSESRYCIDLIKAYTGIGDSKYTMAELIVHNQKKGYQEVINPEIFIQDVDNIIVDYHNT